MLVSKIPQVLLYEESQGKAIYYKGYKDVLAGKKQLEEIMGSSSLQGLLISKVMAFLFKYLDEKLYALFTNEIGIQIEKGEYRACDMAIFDQNLLKDYNFNDKYFNIAPKIVIEVDVKADLSDSSSLVYFQEKTQKLLDFGVQKVIWITTSPRKVTIADPQTPWLTQNWTDTFEIIKGLNVNLNELLPE